VIAQHNFPHECRKHSSDHQLTMERNTQTLSIRGHCWWNQAGMCTKPILDLKTDPCNVMGHVVDMKMWQRLW